MTVLEAHGVGVAWAASVPVLGIGIVVSHDRALLERLPRAILRVHEGAVSMYEGRWSEARASWEAARRAREEDHARAR